MYNTKAGIVMYTGAERFDICNQLLEVEYLKQMLKDKVVTVEQETTVLKMLNSTDKENFYLAKELINSLKPKSHVNSIHSKRSQIRKHKC